MKILWLVPRPFPEALSLLTGVHCEKKSSGGWQIAAAEQLIKNKDVELIVVSSSSLVKKCMKFQGGAIQHYIFPAYDNYNDVRLKENWLLLKKELMPDIIHVHGTEYPHGISFINACGPDNVVVSVQGLMSVIFRYYRAGLDTKQILRNLTLYDIFRRQSIFHEQNKFKKIGTEETELLRRVSYVIGRTSWDKAHVLAINPMVNYYHCNESLRYEFYNGRWNYTDCRPHSIFVSQASFPVKGLQIALKAFALLKKKYPDLIVRIAGSNFLTPVNLKEKLKYGGFAKIITKMIRELDLQSTICFTGPLAAEQMKAEYLKSNVFLSPSTIENSPNSLGEAQILGVPCIASYVGGVPDFIPNVNCGELYRFEEYEMMAQKISDLFESSKSFDNTEMRNLATDRHNREKNAEETIRIYKQIIQNR